MTLFLAVQYKSHKSLEGDSCWETAEFSLIHFHDLLVTIADIDWNFIVLSRIVGATFLHEHDLLASLYHFHFLCNSDCLLHELTADAS